jgi:hypothetical protein
MKQTWSSGWKAMEKEALRIHAAAIQHSPSKYAEKVKAFLREMQASRKNLDSIRSKLPNPPRTAQDRAAIENYKSLEARYSSLAAGFYSDASVAKQGVGLAPMLVVGGLVVGVAAIAWSVAAWEYAVNLREQTTLADRELTARVDASKEGRSLQPTTLPPPPTIDIKKNAEGVGLFLVGGLAIAAAAVLLPTLLKKAG